jgi:hypothetical protein
MTDEEFFSTHRDRQARIRPPSKLLTKTKQRAMHYAEEFEAEFRALGPHKKDRRRVLIWRVPTDNPWFNQMRQPLLPIPFLLFADETVEDTDEILLPIIHQLMLQKRDEYAQL